MPINTQQPTLTLKFGLMTRGIFPQRDGGDGASLAIGHLRIFGFDFVPSRGGVDTGGQAYSISENSALFAVIGTTYGGNGQTTGGIPNFGGRVAIGEGQGPGLSFTSVGEIRGFDSVTLAQANLPGSRGGVSAAIDTSEESQTINYVINPFGLFPSGGGAAIGLVGQITAFAGNFEPNGQLLCDGRLLPISEYGTLFAVIGTIYGGDGVDTFGLPDLRGRTPVGAGNGVTHGERFGSETVSIGTANLPTAMGGSGSPISNYGPSLGITYLVATEGIFPSRDGGLSGLAGDEPMLGEIIMFAGTRFPDGYIRAEGQLLSIDQNQGLFSLFGTTYGGDGQTTFAVPDLRGRAAADDTLSQPVGTVLGQASTTLTLADFPAVSLNGDGSDNSYFGANQADTLNGNGGDDSLSGNGGNDILNGGTGNDAMSGGTGNDIYIVDSPDDVVSEVGGSGIDRVEASASSFTLPTGVEDLEYTGNGAFTGTGNDGANIIVGGGQGDLLSGGAGDDNLGGEAGSDVLIGGAGNDRLVGGTGADIMNGGADNDTLVVDNAGDFATGGAGTDTVEIVASLTNYAIDGDIENITVRAASTVIGNTFDNLFGGSAGDDGFTAGDGNDTAYGRAGTDTLSGENGNDRLFGDAGSDTLSGGSGSDSIYGGADNDIITGGADADALYGEAGTDTLTGGGGRDMLYGGAGNDIFAFDDGDSGATVATADRIMDFAAGDRIDLSAIDAIVMDSTTPFSFIGTGAFTSTAGQLRYQFVGAETYVYGDMNGDGMADLIIRVQGSFALTAADFVL